MLHCFGTDRIGARRREAGPLKVVALDVAACWKDVAAVKSTGDIHNK
jgi:hypothetical protein